MARVHLVIFRNRFEPDPERTQLTEGVSVFLEALVVWRVMCGGDEWITSRFRGRYIKKEGRGTSGDTCRSKAEYF